LASIVTTFVRPEVMAAAAIAHCASKRCVDRRLSKRSIDRVAQFRIVRECPTGKEGQSEKQAGISLANHGSLLG